MEDQYEAARETCVHIADMIEAGYEVIIGHGNGPQVGFILRRSEIAAKAEGMHEVPLDVCGADTQGAIGYALQQNLQNELRQARQAEACGDGRDAGAGGQERPGLQESDEAHRRFHGGAGGQAPREGDGLERG